jgi:hypothetical protein
MNFERRADFMAFSVCTFIVIIISLNFDNLQKWIINAYVGLFVLAIFGACLLGAIVFGIKSLGILK